MPTIILKCDLNHIAGVNNRPDPSPAPTPNYAPLSENNDDELLAMPLDIV